MTSVVQEIWVARQRDGLPVVRLEGRRDLVSVVDEVKDERPVLVRVGAVEAGQRLHCGQPGECLVDVHGVQLGLVEPGLELLRHHQELRRLAVEAGRGLGLREPVELGLGHLLAVVPHRAREGDQHAEVIAVVVDVAAQCPEEPHRVRPGRGHDHRLGLPADLVGDVLPEVLDDDLGTLGQVVLVQCHEAGDRPAGLGRLERRVLADRLLDVPERLVGRVVGQHVVDKALLDGLAHRVQVERLVPVDLRVAATEQLQRLALGRGGEGEEAQVGLPAPGGDGDRQGVFHRVLLEVVVALGRAEHTAQLLGGFAGLRGVGLVDDQRVPARRELLDLVEDEGALLQSGDDDPRLLTGERRRELAGMLVDPLHHAVDMLELVDGLLELAVQDDSVGDHHDLVEHLPVRLVMQGRQPVAKPRDRVRLPRAGRVLHQVVLPGALGASHPLQAEHAVPLVVTREDRRRLPDPLLRLLGVHEPGEEVQPCVPLPHLLPQVGGRMPVGIRRVAGPPAVATVERQEARGRPFQPRGHRDPLCVDREVHDRPLAQRHVPGVPVPPVLGDRVLDVLPGELVLQLGRGYWNAIDEEHEVERRVRPLLIPKLPGDRQPVGRIPFAQLGRERLCRPEVREPDRDALIHHAVPQHVDGSPPVDLPHHPVQELGLRGVRVAAPPPDDFRPTLCLGRPNEREQLRPVQPKCRVEVAGVALLLVVLRRLVAAMGDQPIGDEGLEGSLVGFHAATSGTSTLPVTTTVMRA